QPVLRSQQWWPVRGRRLASAGALAKRDHRRAYQKAARTASSRSAVRSQGLEIDPVDPPGAAAEPARALVGEGDRPAVGDAGQQRPGLALVVGPGRAARAGGDGALPHVIDRKSTRLNSSHVAISYAVFCLKKK